MTRRVLCAAAVLLVVLCVAIAQQAGRPVLAAETTSGPHRLPARLIETGLYADAAATQVAPGNRPFSPQYPLWSDGLIKKRWIHLPPGPTIDGRDEANWDFPVGTRFWKEFSAGSRRVETRMLWKVAPGRWLFATYEWNADGTDAVLAPDAGRTTEVEVGRNRRHDIPSRDDCTACHGRISPRPLGFTALQLSTDRDPHSIHGEPLGEDMVTNATLVAEGRLSGSRDDLVAVPPRIASANPETRTVLGYLTANCSMCHDGNGEITASGPVLRYDALLRDADEVARSLWGARTRWQVPEVAEGESVLVDPAHPERSAIVVRMKSRSPSSQMPPLGTAVRDQQAVDAVMRWVAGMKK